MGRATLHRLGRSLGRRWFRVVDYSHHQYSMERFTQLLAAHGFRLEKVLPFGSRLPMGLQRQRFGGTLLMFGAAKEV
jgi:hypothetical protein